ncbi:MAG: hypothetical protein ACQGVK_15040 [Myxococcota bacterium]
MEGPPEPGQELYVLASSALTPEARSVLDRLGITRQCHANVTYVDHEGLSFYLRGSARGDIEAYCPFGHWYSWMSFFELGTSVNPSYAASHHASRRFPDDF